MKRILYALLLVPFIFSSCKKNDNPNEFDFDGIHDISLNYSGRAVLTLEIFQKSGDKLPVDISVIGLPNGITADVTPINGIPDFKSTITFHYNSRIALGTYPIKIVGKSSSYTRTVEMNLIARLPSSFEIDTSFYPVNNITRVSGGLIASDYFGISIRFLFKDLPTTTTTYNVKDSPNLLASDEVFIDAPIEIPGQQGSRWVATGADLKKVTFNVINGKISCSFSEIEVSNGLGSISKLSASLTE